MYLPFALAVAATTAFVVEAAPAKNDKSPNQRFSVQQVSTGRLNSKPAPPIAMANTYAKYGVTSSMPVAIKVAAANAVNNGMVLATPESNDQEYLCPVQIGTPPQTLMLNFDTGSADLWTFSVEQPSSQSSGHAIYDPSKSSTSSYLTGATWNITYGDGSGAYGDVFTDTVSVGQSVFAKQAVEAAQSVSAQFVGDTNNDGLLGLAMSTINTVRPSRQLTFFDNVKSSLSAPLFTANLKKGSPGSYNFGYIDSTQFVGSITYVPVITSRGFWQFTSNGYRVGGGNFTSLSIDAIADTGTSLLYLPADVVSAYWSKNGGSYDSSQGGYTFPCSTALTPFSLGIGSYMAVVPGSYMNYAGPVRYSGRVGYCFGGLQANTGIGFSILGDVFLKSQFVVFQGSSGSTGPQLGFAAQNSNYVQPTASSTTVNSPASTSTSVARASSSKDSSQSTTSSIASVTTRAPIPISSTTSSVAATTTPKSSSTSTGTAASSSSASACYADNVNGARTFFSASTTSDSMTNAYCQSYCNTRNYAYSGTEYSRECYCSNTAPTVTSTQCTMTCSGSTSGEICGGPNALSVLYNPSTSSKPSQFTAANANGQCASDYYPAYNQRTLSGSTTSSSSMTPIACGTFCKSYKFYGIEYGSECYCGNTIANTAAVASNCTSTCSGGGTGCGGGYAMNIYTS